MAVFIMLTRPRARPEQLEKLEKDVVKREKDLGKGVTWRANYAVLRPYDHLDICEAPDIEERVRRIVAAAMIASLALGADADDIRPDDGIAAATAAGARSRLRKCWRVAARFELFQRRTEPRWRGSAAVGGTGDYPFRRSADGYLLEVYLVAGTVATLPAGIYRYGLVRTVSGDRRRDLAAAGSTRPGLPMPWPFSSSRRCFGERA